jgi:predicted DsbA family dithiol-disulfide isomerase
MRVIEVFADVRCPFTHVGLRRLAERRRATGAEFLLRVRAWPLELVNGEPLDVDHESEIVDALRRQVATELFQGYDAARFSASSLPALELEAIAYRHDPMTGERASYAVRDALFEEGRDVADPTELCKIAAALGLPTATGAAGAVEDDWREGRRRGVIGSPHFFVGATGAFCPGLRIEHRDGELSIAEASTLPAFLQQCLDAR